MIKKIVVVLVALVICCMSVGSFASEDSLFSMRDKNEKVTALHEKLTELGFYFMFCDIEYSAFTEIALKKLQNAMGWEETGKVKDEEELERILSIDHIIGKNLAVGTSSEWSEWMTPEYNAENKTFNITYAELGEKKIEDKYTCQVDIEFKDVTATEGKDFAFWAQGSVDKSWQIGNIWDIKIVRLNEAPDDGVYHFTATSQITENNVNAEKFNLGFRCDNWASGSFRVKNIKVEKGSKETEWVK